MNVNIKVVSFITGCAFLINAIGFGISGAISDHIQSNNEKYTTAVQIEDKEQFEYAMKTNFGNALVYGDFKAVDPVTYPELGGSYLFVRKTEENYRRHTRQVSHTKTVNGKTKTYYTTEVYYSWDYAGDEEIYSDKITFLGNEFEIKKFNLPYGQRTELKDGSYYYKPYTNTRYYYETLPASFMATIHTNLMEGDIEDNIEMFTNEKPSDVVENKIKNKNIPIIIFWSLWIGCQVIAVVYFVKSDCSWFDN